MTPKDYYYNQFRNDFAEFVARSRMAHNHPHVGIYLPLNALQRENLTHIAKDNYMLFHCALAGTVLIDEVMYTHFKEDYPRFQAMTLYPKFEYGISSRNVNPWDITHDGIGLTTLERFLEFFVEDLKEFFQQQAFQSATWEVVRSAMLNDHGATDGSRGEILKKILEETK